jgi:hypothetical protein
VAHATAKIPGDDNLNDGCTCPNKSLTPLPPCDLPSCAEHYPLLQSLPFNSPLFQIKYALLQSQPQATFLLSVSTSTQVLAMRTQGRLVSVTSLTAWLSRYLHPCFFFTKILTLHRAQPVGQVKPCPTISTHSAVK